MWSSFGASIRKKNKLISGDEDITFLGGTRSKLIHSKRKLETKHYNYLVFWTPSYYESSVGENSEYVKSRRLDYVFHLWSV
jgi:REP element-mobilizing transposase RayT